MSSFPDDQAQEAFPRPPSSTSGQSTGVSSTADALCSEEFLVGSKALDSEKGNLHAPIAVTVRVPPVAGFKTGFVKRRLILGATLLAALVVAAVVVPFAVRTNSNSTSTDTSNANAVTPTETKKVLAPVATATSAPTAVDQNTSGLPPVSTSGMCGALLPSRNLSMYPQNLRCPGEACCGKTGWCGFGATFCGTLCQTDYGVCGGDFSSGYKRSLLRTPQNAVLVGTKEGDFTKPICTKPGQVAITFDDGPFIFTEKILDDLKNENVKATFFVNGFNYGDIYQYNATLLRAVKEGHQIASHTWGHPNISNTAMVPNFSQLDKNELIPMEAALKTIIGRVPTYFRPPFGEFPASYVSQIGALGYSHVAVWNLNTLDTLGCTTAACVSQNTANALTSQKPDTASFIQLQHDPLKITADGWAATVDLYRKAGFNDFVTVHECLTGSADLAQAYTP